MNGNDEAWARIQAEKQRNSIKDCPALEAGLIADGETEKKEIQRAFEISLLLQNFYENTISDERFVNVLKNEIKRRGFDLEEPGPLPFQADIVWPDITPLKAELLPIKELSPEMLPHELSDWLVDGCERMDHSSFEYAAVSAVVLLSSLIGRKLGVQPKQRDDWAVVPNLWGCCIGRPGTKKTPVMKEVLAQLRQMESKAREDYKFHCKEYQADLKICELEAKKVEKEAAKLIASSKRKEAQMLLMDDSSSMEKPSCQRFIVNDSTIEKLGVILSANPSGILVFRDELSGWISSLNRNDRMQDRAFWLESYSGDGTFSYDRIGRDDVFIESNTVSILGGIQPGKLLPLLLEQRNGTGDDGLLERFQLMVYPDSNNFNFTDRSPNNELKKIAYSVFDRFKNIPYLTDGTRPSLHFDNESQEVFNCWYCELMKRIQDGDFSIQMESHLNKYPSLLASLALIFHCIRHGPRGCINIESTEMAIRWCDVLATHAARIYSLIDDPLSGAKILADRLDKLSPSFKMKDLEHKNWSGLTTPGDRQIALYWLAKHGYIVKQEAATNGRPSITYLVNPKVSGSK